MRRTTGFVICIDNKGNEASLIRGKIYRALPDARAAKDDLVRIVDESGEDYLYPSKWFVSVKIPQAVKISLLRAS